MGRRGSEAGYLAGIKMSYRTLVMLHVLIG
jgi:hypothetical protein